MAEILLIIVVIGPKVIRNTISKNILKTINWLSPLTQYDSGD